VTITLMRPHRGPVTQRYGNIQPDGLPHAGQDYGYSDENGVYPEIFAAADGVVLFAGDSRDLGWPNDFYVNPDFNRNDDVDNSAGNLTVIGHYESGKLVAVTGYGHQASISVHAGQSVRANQQIGITGDTGYAFGKHLHFFLMLLPYNYATPTYGCSDPNPYFADSLSYAGGPITPLEDDMPITDTDAAKIADVLLDRVRGESTLGQMLSEYRGHALDIIRVVNRVPDTVLDTAVAGVAGDNNTLRQLLSEYRSHILQIVGGTANVPNAVLNAQFTLPDGTITNLAGILAAIHAQPVTTGNVNTPNADPQAIAKAVLDGIRDKWSK